MLATSFPPRAHLSPTWVMGYDLSPIDSIDNRHRYYRDAIPERWLTVFTHDPGNSLGLHLARRRRTLLRRTGPSRARIKSQNIDQPSAAAR